MAADTWASSKYNLSPYGLALSGLRDLSVIVQENDCRHENFYQRGAQRLPRNLRTATLELGKRL